MTCKRTLTSWNRTPVKSLSNSMAFPRMWVLQPMKSFARWLRQSVWRWNRKKIEISHRLNRKKEIKPIVAKFANHKDKAKCYKSRICLKDVTLSTIFPSYSGTSLANQRIFINENLMGYRSEMMKLAIKKRRDGKILSTWSLDGKLFVKTSPLEDQDKCFRLTTSRNFNFQPSCHYWPHFYRRGNVSYRIYPRIGRTFFKEKTFEIWGAAYTRVQEF